MKIKRWIAFALLLIIGGGVTAVIGFGNLGWDVSALDTTEYTQQILDLSNEAFEETKDEVMTSFTGEINSWDIYVVKGDEFKLEYYTTENSEVSYSYANGELKFKIEEKWHKNFGVKWFNGMKKAKLKITLTIPENLDLALKINSSDLYISDMKLNDISLSGNSDDFELKNFECNNLSVNSHSSDIDIVNITAASAKLEGNSTKYKCDNISLAGNLTFDGNSSNVKINNGAMADANLNGNSTTVKLDNFTAAKIQLNGNSSNWGLTDVTCESLEADGNSSTLRVGNVISSYIKFDGSSGNFKSYDDTNIDCGQFELSGNSTTIKITLKGSLADFKTINTSGGSNTIRIGGEKKDSYIGTGSKTLTYRGNSGSLKIEFAE